MRLLGFTLGHPLRPTGGIPRLSVRSHAVGVRSDRLAIALGPWGQGLTIGSQPGLLRRPRRPGLARGQGLTIGTKPWTTIAATISTLGPWTTPARSIAAGATAIAAGPTGPTAAGATAAGAAAKAPGATWATGTAAVTTRPS